MFCSRLNVLAGSWFVSGYVELRALHYLDLQLWPSGLERRGGKADERPESE